LRSLVPVFVALTLALPGAGCLGPSLSHAEASPELLVAAVAQALAERDEARLRELALDEQEFREVVWPDLPAAKPERNLPFSYVWGDLRVRSDAALASLLREYGGQKLAVTDLWFRGGTTQYASYVVYRTPTLRVVDAQGMDHELRLFGSIVEHSGRFKLFSYVVD
jgi:hypothetical protein